MSFSYKDFKIFEVEFFLNVFLLPPVQLGDGLMEGTMHCWSEDLDSNSISNMYSLYDLRKLTQAL